jgi:hypothetical protein
VGFEGCALSIVARHLLTDGHLNQGIVEPNNVEALTRSGLSKDAIRTSCLGFGDDYNEVFLAIMRSVGDGQLHDADLPEKFPIILADELDELQRCFLSLSPS